MVAAWCSGRSPEDIRQIKNDSGLRAMLGIGTVPNPDATGDWLWRMGTGPGLNGLEKVNQNYVRRALNLVRGFDFTLDIDATQIVTEKQDALITAAM